MIILIVLSSAMSLLIKRSWNGTESDAVIGVDTAVGGLTLPDASGGEEESFAP